MTPRIPLVDRNDPSTSPETAAILTQVAEGWGLDLNVLKAMANDEEIGRSAGLTEEKMAHLGDDPLPEGVYDPSEAAIVRYAQATALNREITREIFDDLTRHFSPATAVQLSFVTGMAAMTNRFHRTFLTPVDPDTGEVLSGSCPVHLPPAPDGA